MLFGKPKQKNNVEFEKPQEGEYYGVLTHLVYLGEQLRKTKFGDKIQEQIYLRFELDSFMRDDNGNPDPKKPFIVGEWLTFSFYSKAKLPEILSKFGYIVDQNGLCNGKQFDLTSIIGKTVKITLENSEYEGKTYQNRSYSKNFAKKELEIIGNDGEPIIFYFDNENFDVDTFQKLPEFLRKKIIDSETVKNDERLLNALSISSSKEEDDGAPF